MTLLKIGVIGTLIVTLTGCGKLVFDDRDGGPDRVFNPDLVAEIEPRIEPFSRGGNPDSYEVFGKTYQVMKSNKGFAERGDASWYGTKFHGRNTSNGERYDMYTISAAHKTLPLPTYLEVTNLENGRQLIVRVNDRGPFHSDRIIDLSYAAAAKLGYADKGTAQVKIRTLDVAKYQREKLRGTPTHTPAQVTVTPLQTPAIPARAKATPLPAVEFKEHAEKTGKVAPLIASPVITEANKPPTKAATQLVAVQPIYIQLGAFSNRANAEQMVKRSSEAQISQHGVATIQPVTGGPKVIYRVRIGPFSSKTIASGILQQLIQKNIGDPKIFYGS